MQISGAKCSDIASAQTHYFGIYPSNGGGQIRIWSDLAKTEVTEPSEGIGSFACDTDRCKAWLFASLEFSPLEGADICCVEVKPFSFGPFFGEPAMPCYKQEAQTKAAKPYFDQCMRGLLFYPRRERERIDKTYSYPLTSAPSYSNWVAGGGRGPTRYSWCDAHSKFMVQAPL